MLGTFNFWYVFAPAALAIAFILGWKLRLPPSKFRLVSGVLAIISGSLMIGLMVKESLDGFIELCGRDAEESEVAGMFLIMLLGICYGFVHFALMDAGQDARMKLYPDEKLPKDEVRYQILKKDLDEALTEAMRSESFKRGNATTFRVRAMMTTTHYLNRRERRKQA